jgi:hypothetical protein
MRQSSISQTVDVVSGHQAGRQFADSNNKGKSYE